MILIRPTIIILLLLAGVIPALSQIKAGSQNKQDTVPTKVDSLKAAIVTAIMRPKILGDTIEYNVEHVNTQPNAVVEELLRRLPGLHVGPDGTITYNGERINHLLLDGEDIFGSTPTMVTRNFDANKIARIQVIDRKSDQAIFTSIDDGSRTKTLNLIMKESAKNGYFGKIDVGGDPSRYYAGNATMVTLKNKMQFTAIGFSANTGITEFTGSAGGSSAILTFLNSNTDPLGASAGTGIPRFYATAIHYANSWNSPSDHLTTNYQYSHYYSQPETSSNIVQILPDSTYKQLQQSQSTNQQDQHWLFGILNWSTSTMSDFKVTFHFSNSWNKNEFSSSNKNSFNDTLVNVGTRFIHDNVNLENIGGDIAWRLKIGKQIGRFLTANFATTKIDNSTSGYLYSINKFNHPNALIENTDTVDQRKWIASHQLQFNGGLTYSQCLLRSLALGLTYDFSVFHDNPLQATYARGNGKYSDIVDSLSSHFESRTLNQHVSVNLQGNLSYFYYTMGIDVYKYYYDQQNLKEDSSIHLQYTNLVPKSSVNYKLDHNTNLNFNFSTFNQQPTIDQLTPATNNTDPIHITIGNPTLKPAVTKDFRLEFHRFKIWILNIILEMTATNRNFSTKTITDSLGRQISQPVNVDGARTFVSNFSIDRKIGLFDLGLHSTNTYLRSVNYINADISYNDTYSTESGITLSSYIQDKFNVQLKTSFMYFTLVSSINTSTPIHYWTQNHEFSLAIYLLKNSELGTDALYTWQQRSTDLPNGNSLLLWNTYISHNFLHNKLAGKFQFNNILNRNTGISRSNQDNVNTETSTNILGRCWLFSAVYHFDKKFKRK